MFREEIIKHAESVAQNLENYPGIAKIEQRTKDHLIKPFFECLGYDPQNPGQVMPEAATDSGKKKIDYMLTGMGNAKIAVEAKPASTTLSAADIQQLREYFTFSKAVAGILTNGLQYWLFTDLDTTNVMDSEPYHTISIEDLAEMTDSDARHLAVLTRSRVSQSAVREQARRDRYRSLVDEVIAQELKSPSTEFVRMVGAKAGIKPLKKATLESLRPLVVLAIREFLPVQMPITPTSEPPVPESPTESSSDDADLTPGEKAALTRKQFKGATLFGKDLSVDNHVQMLIAVVKQLRARHPSNFNQVVENPKLFRGRKWWAVSKDPKNLSPRNPQNDTNKVGDFYVDVHLSAEDKMRRAHQFLEAFGHRAEELEIQTSAD